MHKFLRFESFSRHGLKTPTQHTTMNEDGLVMAHTLFAVIDGATDHKGTRIDGKTSGAFLADYLHRNLTHIAQDATYAETEAVMLLAGVNRAFGEKLRQDHPNIVAEGLNFGPAAAVCLVKFHQDNSYSYAIASDCALVELGIHGEVFVAPEVEKPYHIEQNRLDLAQNLMVEQNLTIEEAFQSPEYKAAYQKFRELLNQEWSVFNGDPALENLILHGRRSLDDVAALVLMTDGMFLPNNNKKYGEKQGAEMAARQMLEHGISAYANGLKTVYDEDPERQKFFRFKHMDDASALLIQFKTPLKN